MLNNWCVIFKKIKIGLNIISVWFLKQFMISLYWWWQSCNSQNIVSRISTTLYIPGTNIQKYIRLIIRIFCRLVKEKNTTKFLYIPLQKSVGYHNYISRKCMNYFKLRKSIYLQCMLQNWYYVDGYLNFKDTQVIRFHFKCRYYCDCYLSRHI